MTVTIVQRVESTAARIHPRPQCERCEDGTCKPPQHVHLNRQLPLRSRQDLLCEAKSSSTRQQVLRKASVSTTHICTQHDVNECDSRHLACSESFPVAHGPQFRQFPNPRSVGNHMVISRRQPINVKTMITIHLDSSLERYRTQSMISKNQ